MLPIVESVIQVISETSSDDSFFKALESMIIEDADKLYEQLLKKELNTIITNYFSDRSSLSQAG